MYMALESNLKVSTCLCLVLLLTNSTYYLAGRRLKSQIMMLAQLILQFLSISIDSYHLQNLVYRYAVSNFDLIDRPARVLLRIITYSELLNFRNTLRACLVALQVSNTP